jgi:hypothetical protein
MSSKGTKRCGLNTDTNTWEICKAKPGNEGKYRCHHGQHDDLTVHELDRRNEEAARQSSVKKSLKRPSSVYASYTSDVKQRLYQELTEQIHREWNGETLNGHENVLVFPQFAEEDQQFLYAEDDPTSFAVYQSVKAARTADDLHRIVHSDLPDGAVVIAYKEASSHGAIDLPLDDAKAVMEASNRAIGGLTIIRNMDQRVDIFDDQRASFSDADLMDMAASHPSSEISTRSIRELIDRGQEDQLINAVPANPDMARSVIKSDYATIIRSSTFDDLHISKRMLNASILSVNGHVLQNEHDIDACSKYYGKALSSPVITKAAADASAQAVASIIDERDQGDHDIRVNDLRSKSIVSYAQRKNPDQKIMRQLFAHGDFSNYHEESNDHYDDEPEYSMTGTDMKALVYGVKSKSLPPERIMSLSENDHEKAQLFLQSSARTALDPATRASLRKLVKHDSPYSTL